MGLKQASDPLTLTAAVGFTALILGIASALPAGRAASVEPVEVLRTE
jgi:ABC-type lipoprotein release transport system permease subunit